MNPICAICGESTATKYAILCEDCYANVIKTRVRIELVSIAGAIGFFVLAMVLLAL